MLAVYQTLGRYAWAVNWVVQQLNGFADKQYLLSYTKGQVSGTWIPNHGVTQAPSRTQSFIICPYLLGSISTFTVYLCKNKQRSASTSSANLDNRTNYHHHHRHHTATYCVFQACSAATESTDLRWLATCMLSENAPDAASAEPDAL